ncbi:MAG: HNH endonuclease family protein [Candidatus Nanopelagicus sp.]|jgi:hypothetical protein
MRRIVLLALLLTSIPTQSASANEPTALAVLNQLEVKGRAPKTGYSRAAFTHWSDLNRDGCDSRNEILKRDLTQIVFKTGTRDCKVISGQLLDPFSGKTLIFSSSKSTVDIDHLVSLSNAWQTGAAYLDKKTRESLANDPLNLLAVDAKLNRQKGDGDAATWLPPLKSFRCEYVAIQVAVKAKYLLWVTSAEREAIIKVLDNCPGQLIPE